MFSLGMVPVMVESKVVCSKGPETCRKSSDAEQCNAARLEGEFLIQHFYLRFLLTNGLTIAKEEQRKW